jgi:hypothetical protein
MLQAVLVGREKEVFRANPCPNTSEPTPTVGTAFRSRYVRSFTLKSTQRSSADDESIEDYGVECKRIGLWRFIYSKNMIEYLNGYFLVLPGNCYVLVSWLPYSAILTMICTLSVSRINILVLTL